MESLSEMIQLGIEEANKDLKEEQQHKIYQEVGQEYFLVLLNQFNLTFNENYRSFLQDYVVQKTYNCD